MYVSKKNISHLLMNMCRWLTYGKKHRFRQSLVIFPNIPSWKINFGCNGSSLFFVLVFFLFFFLLFLHHLFPTFIRLTSHPKIVLFAKRQLCIWKMLLSNLCQNTKLSDTSWFSSDSYRNRSGQHVTLGQTHFLPNHFQCIFITIKQSQTRL